MRPPAINDAPLNTVSKFAGLAPPVQLIQAASCRAATVLWVLCKGDSALYAVTLHFPGGLGCERIRVPEGDVRLVRRGFRVELVQQCSHTIALETSILEDGRATTDILVLLLDLRRATARDQGS